MIPITVVEFGSEEEQLVLEALRSGRVAQGPLVARFEESFAELTGVKHAVAVNNGTTSLVATLQAFDLRPGDEVVTSPFTFAATLNAILEAGATARFADISDIDFNVDPPSVADRVSDRTRVLMPVHLYGQIADMAQLMPIAEQRGMHVLEDAAQAHGSTQDGKAAGSFGVGSFSFYATKNITTGEGGVITTDDDTLAEKLRILRNQGMRARYEYVMHGHNYRMTDLQAALGIPQIARYGATVEQRARNAAYLTEALADVPGLVTPREMPGRRHVWHQYTVRITPDARLSRDEFVEQLTAAGIGAGVYYPRLVHDYDAYRDLDNVIVEETPVAAQVAKEAASLPVHTHLTRAQLDEIADTTRRLLGAER